MAPTALPERERIDEFESFEGNPDFVLSFSSWCIGDDFLVHNKRRVGADETNSWCL
jgi:hypothetical protein